MKVKLAELLLRRKELTEKVKQTASVKVASVFETKVQRVKVHEGIDEVTAVVPKLTLGQVTAEHDHYAGALRRVDSAIQQANWATEIDVLPTVMQSWDEVNDQRKAAMLAVKAATPQPGDGNSSTQ